MLVGVGWGYRPTVWHNYNIQTGVILYMHIANNVFHRLSINTHHFDIIFFPCSLLRLYDKRWGKKKGSDNFVEVEFFIRRKKKNAAVISRRSFFITVVLVTNVKYFILWVKRRFFSCHPSAHKRVHCGHVDMFK